MKKAGGGGLYPHNLHPMSRHQSTRFRRLHRCWN